jgi:hypothetical protein
MDRLHQLCAIVGVTFCISCPTFAQEAPRETPDRILGLLPNFTAVEDPDAAPPITTTAGFRMATQNSFDPAVFPFVGAIAALAQADNHDKPWGGGAAGYGRRFAISMADNSIGSFFTTAIAPALFHQDPRYFELREGSVLQRVGYAASRTLVTRNRSGERQFNYSEMAGTAAAAVISNAYYPSESHSSSDTLTRWGTQAMWDTVSNELKEFWPDIRRKLHKS